MKIYQPSIIPLENIDGEYRVDSRLIAPDMGVKHKTLIETARKFQKEIRTFGVLPFKAAKPLKGTVGGRPETYIHLNEPQATFVLTLSRNTEKIVKLKLRLTKSFFYYKNQAQEKVDFFDSVANSKDLFSFSSVGKMKGINLGQKRLFKILRENEVLFDDGPEKNQPYQKYLDNGFFEVVPVIAKNGSMKKQTHFTGKGIIWLKEHLPSLLADYEPVAPVIVAQTVNASTDEQIEEAMKECFGDPILPESIVCSVCGQEVNEILNLTRDELMAHQRVANAELKFLIARHNLKKERDSSMI